ncbi:MAG: triacylglycerol lipase [Bacteroidia bacterium]
MSHFCSVSGLLHGTLHAHFWLGKASRDMHFRSKLLRQLNADAAALDHTMIHSYRTPFDWLIIPTRSSHWKIATDNHIVAALFHHRMLIPSKEYRHIAETLKPSD